MNLHPYLHYDGTCEEAMNFYKQALNGELTGIQTFGQSPMPVPDDLKNRIMHAELRFGDNVIMASDSMPDQKVTPGTNFAMSLNFTDPKEQEEVYNRLAAGGMITMPLQDQFWGARFGMLTDKFGISWMLNCPLKQEGGASSN